MRTHLPLSQWRRQEFLTLTLALTLALTLTLNPNSPSSLTIKSSRVPCTLKTTALNPISLGACVDDLGDEGSGGGGGRDRDRSEWENIWGLVHFLEDDNSRSQEK